MNHQKRSILKAFHSRLCDIHVKLFIATFLMYLFCNNGINWDSGSERVRYAQIKSLVEDKTLYIDRFISTFPNPVPFLDVALAPSGHYYPNKPPGLTLLGVPIVFITSILGIKLPFEGFFIILLTCGFTSATVVLLYSLCSDLLKISKRISLLVSFTYSYTTLAFPHAVTFYANPFSAFFVLSTVYLLIDRAIEQNTKNKISRLFVSGTFAGFLLLLDYSNVIFLLPFLLYIASSRKIHFILVFFVPVTFLTMILMYYHYICFGTPFVTTYDFAIYSRNTFDWRYNRPLIQGLRIFLISRRRGLFFYSPVLLFSFLGFYLMLKSKDHRKEGALFLSSFLLLLVFFSYFAYSSGMVFGSRRLDPVIPLLCIPIAHIMSSPNKLFPQRFLSRNQFLKKLGFSLFWCVFLALFIISLLINGVGAISDVHPKSYQQLDYNVALLLSGTLHSLLWNYSPFLGFLVLAVSVFLHTQIILTITKFSLTKSRISQYLSY